MQTSINTHVFNYWFRQFNAEIFGNKLPEIPIMLSKSKGKLGTITKRTKIDEKKTPQDFYQIRISIYYNRTEKEYQDTLIHEMIHYYIMWNKIKDTSPHGEVFRKMMTNINEKFGRNMHVSEKHIDTTQTNITEVKLRLILALKTKDGRFILNPVQPAHAKRLDGELKNINEVEFHKWFISKDVFFNNFKTVRTLRGRVVSEEIFNEKTRTMQPFKI